MSFGKHTEVNSGRKMFLLGFCFLYSIASAQINQFQSVKESASRLANNQEVELWKIPTEIRSADIIQFLDNERVLVGGIITEGLYSANKFGPLYLLNKEGKILWTFERNGSADVDQLLIKTEPELVFATIGNDKPELWALSAADGKKQWTLALSGNPTLQNVSEENKVVVLSRDKKEHSLQVIDLEEGQTSWEKSIEKTYTRLQVIDNKVFVIGSKVKAFDLNSGDLNWEFRLSGIEDDPVQLTSTPAGLMVWTGSRYSLLNPEDGKARWSGINDKGGIKLVSASDNQIFLVIGGENILDTDQITALSIDNGNKLWEADADGLITSSLILHNNILHFSIEDVLIGLIPESGKQAYYYKYEESYARLNPVSSEYGSVPDLIRPNNELLVIDRDGAGLWAYDLNTGGIGWEVPTLPGRPTLERAYGALFGGNQQVNNAAGPPQMKLINWTSSSPNQALTAAERMHNATMEQKNRVLSDRTSTSAERSSAIQASRVSSSLEISRIEANMAVQQTMAATQFAASIISTAQIIQQLREQQFFSNAFIREKMKMKALILDRGAAFKGDSHISMFEDLKGSGVRFVNLENGDIRKLYFQPKDPLQQMLGVFNGKYGISPTGDRMIMVGIGIDQNSFKSVKKNKITGAAPSILCFDPGSAKTEEQIAASSSEGRVSKAFTDAIMNGDVDAARSLLEGGEDPNGLLLMDNPLVKLTPMRISASKPEMVRVLLEYGAKPISVKEIPGLNAMDAVLSAMIGCLPECPENLVTSHDLLKEAGFVTEFYPDSVVTKAANAIPIENPPPIEIPQVATANGFPPDLQLYHIRRMLNDPEVGDSWKKSPILGQAYRIDRDLFYELIDRGADINSPVLNGSTLLHGAVATMNKTAIEDFLELGLDPNLKNNEGYTPMTLMFHPYNYNYVDPSGKQKMITVLKILLENGADPNTSMPPQPDGKNLSLLEVAQGKDKDFVKVLKEYGASK